MSSYPLEIISPQFFILQDCMSSYSLKIILCAKNGTVLKQVHHCQWWRWWLIWGMVPKLPGISPSRIHFSPYIVWKCVATRSVIVCNVCLSICCEMARATVHRYLLMLRPCACVLSLVMFGTSGYVTWYLYSPCIVVGTILSLFSSIRFPRAGGDTRSV